MAFQNHAWVTSALCDDDVPKALVLCYSLKRNYTTRKLAIIASSKLSPQLRHALHSTFDVVIFIEENWVNPEIKPEDFAKLYSFLALRSYEKCVYLSPKMLVLKNCDALFEQDIKGLVMLESQETSVFAFNPSMKHYKTIISGMRNSNQHANEIGKHLCNWAKNQYGVTGCIDQKYNRIMQTGTTLFYQIPHHQPTHSYLHACLLVSDIFGPRDNPYSSEIIHPIDVINSSN